MKIGLIGMGKMGYNLALNLKRNGHEVVGYDVNQTTLQNISNEGVATANSLDELVNILGQLRVIWLMIPAGEYVDSALSDLKPLLSKGDIIVEAGNSNYKDSIRRAAEWSQQGIEYLDCGTSGGIEGALNGICAMIGGNKAAFDKIEPIFKDISLPEAYLYCGASGAGHYVKMMHSSGEGKWALETAMEKQIATPVIALALIMRYRSLEDDTFAGKLVATLRNEFGGHAVVKK